MSNHGLEIEDEQECGEDCPNLYSVYALQIYNRAECTSMKFLDIDHKTGCVCKNVLLVGWGAWGVAFIEIVKYSDFKLSENISTLTKNITKSVNKYIYNQILFYFCL